MMERSLYVWGMCVTKVLRFIRTCVIILRTETMSINALSCLVNTVCCMLNLITGFSTVVNFHNLRPF